MPFTRAKQTLKQKPDKKGKIVIRIFKRDEKKTDFFPEIGNRREDIIVDEATVGEVFDVIEQTLFDREDEANLMKSEENPIRES